MMALTPILGQTRSWNLLTKIGEGDAGEVYLVESLLEKKRAILKRPQQGGFPTDVIRQSTQIESEGKILKYLQHHKHSGMRKFGATPNVIHIPELLDTSPPNCQFSDRYFIVIELATGFSLSTIAKTILTRQIEADPSTSPEEYKILKSVAESGQFPQALIVRSIAGILQLFDAIHANNGTRISPKSHNLIWNDLKPEHIFWDPRALRLTFIDWGNAQLLEDDGYSKDRLFSRMSDYAQFFESMGAFLKQHDPELFTQLKWSDERPIDFYQSSRSFEELLRQVKEKIDHLLRQQAQYIRDHRQQEDMIINSFEPELDNINSLIELQNQIAAQAELPDFQGAERVFLNLASRLVSEGRFDEFILLDQYAHKMNVESQAKWDLINEVAELANTDFPGRPEVIRQVITSGLADDWGSMLWGLLLVCAEGPEPPWWNRIASSLRQVGLQLDPSAQPPLIVLKRAILEMQAILAKSSDDDTSTRQAEVVLHSIRLPGAISNREESQAVDKSLSQPFDQLIKILREEIVPNWSKVDPDPPHSTLEYNEIVSILPDINRLAPGVATSLSQSLEQPRAKAAGILEAWERRDFNAARHSLRQLLIWDPNRWRVLTSEKAILRANDWLNKVRNGPQNEQPLLEFITEFELMGRELRSQVGPADWLEHILNAFTQIRKGRRLAELIIEAPELKRDLPWLDSIEPHRYIPESALQPINLHRSPANLLTEPFVKGTKSGLLGDEFILADPLDTWSPEARGSSARVFTGFIMNTNGQLKQAAIKIMRPEQLEYALPLFREEIRILEILRGAPGITPLLECGFIKLADDCLLPSDQKATSGRSLRGEILRFSPDSAANYLNELETRVYRGWLAYLVTPKLDNQENLMWFCDAGFTRGRFLPLTEGLRLTIQICDLIQLAHDRNIVYRDHKLLHYYWLAHFNGVFMIDWNVARYHPDGLSKAEVQFDLVQLGARALHHILTGRVAPGALADGPNRVEEIESAASSYSTKWTYDDQRLPPDLKAILEQVLNGSYSSANSIKEDLLLVYNQLLEDPAKSQSIDKSIPKE